jgi:hypothetical protein
VTVRTTGSGTYQKFGRHMASFETVQRFVPEFSSNWV